MNVTYYVLSVAAALVLAMALYALRLRGLGKPSAAAVALPLSALLGFVLAKALYVLLQLNYVWRRYGAASLTRLEPTEFSFFGGMAGVLLGVIIASRLLKQPLRRSLDAFAVPMALLAALWKFSEGFLGTACSGNYVENEAFMFFPVAVVNEWEEWYYAVFMLAGVCALAACIVSALRTRRHADIPGMLFARTAFYLALPLALCESLRIECMKWGFVKCEQVLCGVTIAAAILSLCLGTKLPRGRRFLPMVGVVLIVIGLVGVEFMLDKLSYPPYVGYSIMLVLLALLALLEMRTVRTRRLHG